MYHLKWCDRTVEESSCVNDVERPHNERETQEYATRKVHIKRQHPARKTHITVYQPMQAHNARDTQTTMEAANTYETPKAAISRLECRAVA